MIHITDSLEKTIFNDIKKELNKRGISEYSSSYVSNVLGNKYLKINNNSDGSLVLLYKEAAENNSLIDFCCVGDESLFRLTLTTKDKETNIYFGELSYYKCYKLSDNKLYYFKELSEKLELITDTTRRMYSVGFKELNLD